MEIIILLAGIVGIWVTIAPFVRIKALNTAVIDDLADYHAFVHGYRRIIRDSLRLLDDNGLAHDALRERLHDAETLIANSETWSALAKADRTATIAFDEAYGILLELRKQGDVRRNELDFWAEETDEKMTQLRMVLRRDMEILNSTPIRRIPYMARLLKLRTYRMTEPLVWYDGRKPKLRSRVRFTRFRRGWIDDCVLTQPRR